MAFTTPKTWAPGAVLTAGEMNTYTRDNVAWLGTSKPHCRVYKTSDQSISSGWPGQALTFSGESVDVGTLHGGSSSQILIGTGMAGWYHFAGQVEWDAVADPSQRRASIVVNGSAYIASTQHYGGESAQPGVLCVSGYYQMAETWFAELHAYQNSGNARAVLGTSGTAVLGGCFLSATWMGT